MYKVVKISDQDLAVKEFLVVNDEYQRETPTDVFEMFIFHLLITQLLHEHPDNTIKALDRNEKQIKKFITNNYSTKLKRMEWRSREARKSLSEKSGGSRNRKSRVIRNFSVSCKRQGHWFLGLYKNDCCGCDAEKGVYHPRRLNQGAERTRKAFQLSSAADGFHQKTCLSMTAIQHTNLKVWKAITKLVG